MPLQFKIAILVIAATSVIGAVLVALDKRRAVRGRYRISEATLMLFGMCGGAALMLLAMRIFHHKTRKPKFTVTFPVFVVIHLVILLLCSRQLAF